MWTSSKTSKRIVAGALGLIISAGPVMAFSTFDASIGTVFKYVFGKQFGFIHREITLAAMDGMQIRENFREKIAYWNWRPDWDETKKMPPDFLPNKCYLPEHHFDRNEIAINDEKHAEAFMRGARYAKEQRTIAVDGLKKRNGRDIGDSLQAIGRAFHALQDFHSHSNFIDLSKTDREAVLKALVNASRPPTALKITGYDIKEGGGGAKGEVFAHDVFSKDEQKKNDEAQKTTENTSAFYDTSAPGKTKFETARDAAVVYSRDWLEGIRREAGDAAWARMMNSTEPLKIKDDGCMTNKLPKGTEKANLILKGFEMDYQGIRLLQTRVFYRPIFSAKSQQGQSNASLMTESVAPA